VETASRRERVGEWMRQWHSGLTRFLEYRVATPIDAQDLAQEVYVRILRHEQLEDIHDPQAYLYRVASNVAAEWRMRAAQCRAHSAAELDALVELTAPDTLVEQELTAQRIDHALRELKPMVAAVVYLKLHENLTHEQIAQRLAIMPRMVRRHLATGYEQLRAQLGG
jgi:RNA polymerase sigma factor (sigma-70 family)